MKLGSFISFCLVALSALSASTGVYAQSQGDQRIDSFDVPQVFVPAGCFAMGTEADTLSNSATATSAPDWAAQAALRFEVPSHQTCLTSGYWIDLTEVTNASFSKFVEAGGYEKPEYWSKDGADWLAGQYVPILPYSCETTNEPNHPRVCITFYEAEAYAHWRGGRLPTEAEWEYAARGPQSLVYPWGNDWVSSNAHVEDAESTAAVGSYPSGVSWVGALDMAGNAMEWVSDWLGEDYYASSPQDDPAGPESGYKKAEKGGWWGSNPFLARSSYKHFEDAPTYQDHHIGFRIVTEQSK